MQNTARRSVQRYGKIQIMAEFSFRPSNSLIMDLHIFGRSYQNARYNFVQCS